MRKRLYLFLLVLLVSFAFVFAQVNPFEGIPGGDTISGLADGENPADNIEDFKDKLVQKREGQDLNYLRQKWTENPVVGKALSYVEGFFDYFNILWKYSFGTEFEWSLYFFLHLGIWLVLVYILSWIMGSLIENSVVGFLVSIVIASLIGASGTITNSVETIEVALTELWMLTIFVLVVFGLLWAFSVFMKDSKKRSEKEKIKKAEDATIARGEVDKEALDENNKP